MTMTCRQRIKAVYRGERPDQVPCMLDLSHWYYHKHRRPWDLSTSYLEPESELIEYHRQMGVGFYLPNLGSFYEVTYPEDVKVGVEKSGDGHVITWSFDTPLGRIERRRIWEEGSYSWAIGEWGVKTQKQVEILAYALANRRFRFLTERYQKWVDCIGDAGVCYVPLGYSGMGHLLSYWMGIEGTMYAVCDWPDTVRAAVDTINQSNLELIDVMAASPIEFAVMGDNFSSDIQPPGFFQRWSRDYYTEAIRRLHRAGKYVAVHIDGRLAGAIQMIRSTGADCADAVTPTPLGDLTPRQCREEAGPDFILSGGVSPDLWLPNVPVDRFKRAITDWTSLAADSPRLIANAGDQVPPFADENRIKIMRDTVSEYHVYSRSEVC
jgi:hypothetical protein